MVSLNNWVMPAGVFPFLSKVFLLSVASSPSSSSLILLVITILVASTYFSEQLLNVSRCLSFGLHRTQLGDAVLCQLNGKPLEDAHVQKTRNEIFLAIQSEAAASKSLQWTQFLTFGLLDRSPERIVRRLSMCFWITFLRQWAVS